MSDQKSTNEKPSALESLDHELYNPKAKLEPTEIHHIKSRRSLTLPSSWGEDTPIIPKKPIIEDDRGVSFGVKLLLIATVLLFTSLAFLAWQIMSQRNLVSPANIDMSADITPFIEGGESTPLTFTLKNRNKAILQDASVTLLYKQGSGSQDEQEKIQKRVSLGDVNTDEFKKQDFLVSLYGSEGETRDIVLKLEYKVAGSNAPFTKLVTAQVVLRAPPVSVDIQGPDKLSIGQTGTYSFIVKNNSATTSIPSVLQLTLPNSFVVETTEPKPLARSTSWTIKALPKGESQTISVTGTFDGKQGELATFVAKIGSQGDNPSSIGIVYSSKSSDVVLRASPLLLVMNLSTDNPVAEVLRYGDKAVITLSYSNASTQTLEDVSITLSLSGDAGIYNLVDPTSGYYDSIKKTITWNKASLLDLAVLPPGAQGTLQVIVPIVAKGTNSPTLKVLFTGSASTKSSDDIVATLSKTYAVTGSATLEARTQYTNSPFPNTGPIPPQPNKETTYTISLKVSAQNTLSNAKVSFRLPAYVTWRNVTSDDKTITYSSRDRTVTWNTGPLAQGSAVSASVGVAVKPSQSHVGGTPAITSGIVLDAEEEVSRARLQTTLSALTTSVYSEVWKENPAIVVDR